MTKTPMRKQSAPTDKVGYGRPPVHSRYPRGVSGNPGGRPPKPKHAPYPIPILGNDQFRATVLAVLQEPVMMEVDGRRVEVDPLTAILRGQIERALFGDPRAVKAVTDLAREALGTHAVDIAAAFKFVRDYKLSADHHVTEALRASQPAPQLIPDPSQITLGEDLRDVSISGPISSEEVAQIQQAEDRVALLSRLALKEYMQAIEGPPEAAYRHHYMARRHAALAGLPLSHILACAGKTYEDPVDHDMMAPEMPGPAQIKPDEGVLGVTSTEADLRKSDLEPVEECADTDATDWQKPHLHPVEASDIESAGACLPPLTGRGDELCLDEDAPTIEPPRQTVMVPSLPVSAKPVAAPPTRWPRRQVEPLIRSQQPLTGHGYGVGGWGSASAPPGPGKFS